MGDEFEQLGLTDMIRLRDRVSEALRRKFARSLALGFTDVVGSTAYFARFGDEVGRSLQQRHFDALAGVLSSHAGRLVDTAGDGAFFCFENAEVALLALEALRAAVAADNALRPREHQLSIRAGLHWGEVLVDPTVVTGDAVNTCARIPSTGRPGELRVSRGFYQELPGTLRAGCRPLGRVELKGLSDPQELFTYEWRDQQAFPAFVRVEETGLKITLPKLDTLSFGRLSEMDGMVANDVVLGLPDPVDTRKISRWHFELRRLPDGFVLRSVSSAVTLVDGRLVQKGEQVRVGPGTVVQISTVMTLTFLAADQPVADPGWNVTSLL